jgi:hypothetical protein
VTISIPPILAFAFLAPALMAAGAAATSIPIIIHLLNKRKFRVIVWAAMDWLLAAQRRNARRLRFHRWLLLALRCLALLIIAAGIAQLVLQNTVLGNFIPPQRTVMILWDDSYSMGYQGAREGGTPFEKSRRLITDYLATLKDADKILVLRTSRLAAAADAASLPKPSLDHAAILAQVRSATLSDASTDLASAFDQAAAILKDAQSSTQVRQVLLLTDFSNSSIHEPPAAIHGAQSAPPLSAAPSSAGGATLSADRLKKSAEALRAAATEFRLFDMGDPAQSNAAVTDLRSHRPAVVAGSAADFDITLFNATDRPLLDAPLSILLDGVPVQTEKLARIDPGSTAAATARLTIPSAGRHLVEARLPSDQLSVDDNRRLLVNARREIPVLLVDGSPGEFFGSTAYLWAAYAFPTENRTPSPFAPKTISELELPTTPLASYDIVVLSNVGELAPAVRENLKTFVDAGGLLMIFPGDRSNTQRMNETLGDRGANLLPATLGQLIKADVPAGKSFSFAPRGYNHPVLSVFAPDVKAGKEIGFTTVQTMEYLKLTPPADGSSEVVLNYANPDGTPGDPAVLLKSAGKGKVALFASTADTTWNIWGAKPSYLPFIHELTYYAMSRDAGGTANYTLRVGDRLHLPAEVASAGAWTGPRDSQVNVTSDVDAQGRAFLASPPLTLAGTYVAAAGDGRPVIAINPDPEEADIRHVDARQMAGVLGIDPALVSGQPSSLASPGTGAASGASGASLGPTLIAAALILFALEALLAMLFSTYR